MDGDVETHTHAAVAVAGDLEGRVGNREERAAVDEAVHVRLLRTWDESRPGSSRLPVEHLDADEPADPGIPAAGDPVESLPLRALLAEVERRAILRALLACGGNRTRTAERLGISRRQLFDKIREYDLEG